MFPLGFVIDGTSLASSGQSHTNHLAPLPSTMAELTRNSGVEECKGFSSLNVPTTKISYIRLPLGFLDSNPRVPNTGSAMPQRLRCREPQRSADLARKGARYAQRTKAQRLHDVQKIRTSGGSLLQNLVAGSPFTGEHRPCSTCRNFFMFSAVGLC